MSQYDNLKATIALNVYQNHNNEVTANMVKAAMDAMTDSLGAGYQYLGIATPTSPGTAQTPDQKVFYIAAQPGTYTNFSGIVVNDGEVAILKWDTAWHKEVTGAATSAQVTELDAQVTELDAKVISLFSTVDKSTYLREGYAIQEDGQLSQVGGSWKAYYKIPIFVFSILDAMNLHDGDISSPYASVVLYDKSGAVIEVYHDKSPLKNYIVGQDGYVSITFTSSGTDIKIQNLNVPINAKYANGVIDKSYASLDYSKYKVEDYALMNDGSVSGASGWNTFYRIPIHKGDIISLTNLLPSSSISSPYASCVICDTSFNVISAFIGNTPLKDYVCESDGFISFMYRSGVTYDGKIERVIDYVSLDITPYFSANRVLLKDGGVDTINGWNSYIKIPIKKGMRIYAQNLSGSNLSGPYATLLIYKNDEDVLSFYQNINPLNGYVAEEDCFISVCTNSGMANIDIEICITDAITSLVNKVTENAVFNCLPQNIDCPVGRNTDIFLDAVSYPINKKCIVGGTSELIRRGNNIVRYSPTTPNTIASRFQIVDDYKKRLSISPVNFRGVSRNNGTGETKSVMIIGDSLVDGTFTAPECFRLLEEDNDFNIIQIGTRTAVMDNITYYEEGRSGWGWADYINPDYEITPYFDRTNAFMHNGVLDFSHYMETNFPDVSTLDYVIIALGTNDCGQGALLLTWTDINKIIDNAKTFIDALLSDYPNCKIAIGLPSVGAPTFPAGNRIAEDFVISMQMLNKAYIDTFDNGKYNSNVTCVAHGLYLDRVNSYQYVDAPNNDYVDMSGNALEFVLTHTRSYIDQVHPALIGYKQWGRGLYGKVRAFLNDLL